ncbi:hypothetical protein [Gordonia sp. WA4-43]|nr:hypothetical protein [Gordonia sp. WA4-43]
MTPRSHDLRTQADREAYEDYCEDLAERRANDFVPVDDFDPIPW